MVCQKNFSGALFFSLLGRNSVPRIASARKNMRKSRVASVRNRAQRSELRTAVKTARSVEASAADRLRAVQLLDRAARRGLIHRNAAARQKSRLAKTGNR
jgi:small subunit ribosomal protein S20